MSTLWAKGLQCRRGGRTVLSGLDFAVSDGEALAVTGPNGAGKSTFLRVIAGLLPIANGQLNWDGEDAPETIGGRAHYLGHQDAVKPSLTVGENLTFWISFLEGKGSAKAALEAIGLSGLADLPAGYLSAGQRRRLSLARLVAIARPLWLLDEPASALDDTAQAMLAEMMRTHLAAGGLIIAATHAPLGIAARELRLGASR